MGSLQGKIAMITGAGGGIGAETARLMAARGAAVALADIDFAAAEAAAATIAAEGGHALPLAIDLTDEASIAGVFQRVIETFGRIDVLDNNAADLSPERSARDRDVETMDLDVWDAAFRVNVRGAMLCCRQALPHMVRRGGGVIVNTASNLALQGNVIQAAYSASKAALLQMTRSIAASHGKKGVRCNAVLPGLTLTRSAREHLPGFILEIMESETLMPRLGEAADIAGAVAFLASDDARHITGQWLVVDGGLSTHVPGFAALRRAMD
jgi:NAD(P)-dependent dehydrogenase (short-subunit alcohol dehydrogenase family)